jgi:hypothetical protein
MVWNANLPTIRTQQMSAAYQIIDQVMPPTAATAIGCAGRWCHRRRTGAGQDRHRDPLLGHGVRVQQHSVVVAAGECESGRALGHRCGALTSFARAMTAAARGKLPAPATLPLSGPPQRRSVASTPRRTVFRTDTRLRNRHQIRV